MLLEQEMRSPKLFERNPKHGNASEGGVTFLSILGGSSRPVFGPLLLCRSPYWYTGGASSEHSDFHYQQSQTRELLASLLHLNLLRIPYPDSQHDVPHPSADNGADNYYSEASSAYNYQPPQMGTDTRPQHQLQITWVCCPRPSYVKISAIQSPSHSVISSHPSSRSRPISPHLVFFNMPKARVESDWILLDNVSSLSRHIVSPRHMT